MTSVFDRVVSTVKGVAADVKEGLDKSGVTDVANKVASGVSSAASSVASGVTEAASSVSDTVAAKKAMLDRADRKLVVHLPTDPVRSVGRSVIATATSMSLVFEGAIAQEILPSEDGHTRFNDPVSGLKFMLDKDNGNVVVTTA